MKKFFFFIACITMLWGVDINSLILQAKQGNSNAIYQLGYIYENGLGVPKDIKRAKALYQKAASLGNKDAQISLALLELDTLSHKSSMKNITNKVIVNGENGLNFSFDMKDLKEIVQKAKENDKDALFTLATLYDSGILKGDKQKAILLYQKAAQLGSLKAQKILSIQKGATRK